jgi:DNA gyrase/topoisomerase IV subunit A
MCLDCGEHIAPNKAQHSPLPLIATSKVDKWLNELREILVQRSEFKLADHVVSARVVIKMLEAKAIKAAHADKLAEALRDCFTSDGATAFARPTFAPQRLRAINNIVNCALAAYEADRA